MIGVRAARLLIDLAMTVMVLLSLSYHMTGNAAHEWIGSALFALFAVHTLLNRKWYANIARGPYDLRRAVSIAVNLLLGSAVAAVVISGLMLSRTIVPFLHVSDGMWVRQVHSVASYWGLILIAVHLGMHWSMIVHALERTIGQTVAIRLRSATLRSLAALIFIGGIAASFDRGMGAKLFFGASFDFWDPSRSVVLFFAANLAIIGLYAGATYYLVKITRKFSEARKVSLTIPRPLVESCEEETPRDESALWQ